MAPWPYRRQRLARLFRTTPEVIDNMEATAALQAQLVDFIEGICSVWASANIEQLSPGQYSLLSEFLFGEESE